MGGKAPIGSVVAGYRLISLVGEGATGAVYLAEREGTSARVALKLLDPELARDERFRQRLIRESTLAASLDHPSAVPIVDFGETQGTLYLAMRYVDYVKTTTSTFAHDAATWKLGKLTAATARHEAPNMPAITRGSAFTYLPVRRAEIGDDRADVAAVVVENLQPQCCRRRDLGGQGLGLGRHVRNAGRFAHQHVRI